MQLNCDLYSNVVSRFLEKRGRGEWCFSYRKAETNRLIDAATHRRHQMEHKLESFFEIIMSLDGKKKRKRKMIVCQFCFFIW